MSFEQPRINLDDSLLDSLITMSEGNPGALDVLLRLVTFAKEVDPDSALDGLGPLFALDNLDCYGANIWILYKDLCHEDLVTMMGVLRGIQLGFISDAEVSDAVAAVRSGAQVSLAGVEAVVRQVKDELPNFGKIP